MVSRHLVDPELLPLLEQFPAFDLSPELLPQIRGMNLAPSDAAPPAGVEVSEQHIPGPAGAPPVRLLLYTPTAVTPSRPAVLHMHPGGFVFGAPEMSDMRNRRLALDLDCLVVSVDYRLAPETRFPGAVEDCYAALLWLQANAAGLGADPGRFAVLGESAGGGLAAALSLLARDRGEVRIGYQSLIYPMLDDRTAIAPDRNPYTGGFVWTAASNKFGWSALLGEPPGARHVPPYAAAARAEDLSGLPPAFIAVGALDLFLEENIEYGRRLLRAGVPAELHIYPGAFHGFDRAGAAQISRTFMRDWQDALRRHFAGGVTAG